MHQRTCPYCDALQSPEARFCRSCGKLLPREYNTPELTVPTTGLPRSLPSPEVFAYARSFRQPLTEVLPVLGALSALVFIGGAVAAVMTDDSGWMFAAFLIATTFLGALLYYWIAGMRNWRKGKEFLLSDRPLVSWIYTPDEWHQVNVYFYKKMRSDSPPYGCLPLLFAGIGLLVGIMVGLGDTADLEETVASALVGVLAGSIVGGVLVLPVYLINRSAIGRLRRPTPPACVALGRGELFYERVHTRIDPQYDRVYIKQGPHMHILVERPKASTILGRLGITYVFPSMILIPPRMASAVQEALPHLLPHN